MRSSLPPPSSSPVSVPSFSGIDGLGDDLAKQRVLLGESNRVYARMLAELEAVLTSPIAVTSIVDRLERAWRERRFTAYFERPLLLLAALRADAMGTGVKHPLAAALANEHAPDADMVTRANVIDALQPDRLALWLMLATRRVQTNEVSRAVTWLWPAHLAGCSDGARKIALVDVGTSGGLNLVADHVSGSWTEPSGVALPVVRNPSVVARIGFDTAPLDFVEGDDASWARACIWPGDHERLRRFDEALAALRSMREKPAIHRLNATLVPARLPEIVRGLPDGALLLVMQTLVRGYMDSDRRDTYTRGMRAFLASAPKASAAWLELELDESEATPPAALVAHVPDGNGGVHSFVLARTSYHPREVDVRVGVTAFMRAMQR